LSVRFIFSVIGVAVVLWWAFVWRLDGKTPARYAVLMWNSPKVQSDLHKLVHELPFEVPAEFQPAPIGKPARGPKAAPPRQARNERHEEPEAYSDEDRRELDALVDRAQNSRND
jgi:hypothetical protein